MKNKIKILIFIGLVIGGFLFFQNRDKIVGAWTSVSIQQGSSPDNGDILQTNGTVSTWVAVSTLGFESSFAQSWEINAGGLLAPTTTISVLANSNLFVTGDTDIYGGDINLGTGTATSTLTSSSGNLGIGTTTPGATLSVTGTGAFDSWLSADYFLATSTTATSTFSGGLALSGLTEGSVLFATSTGEIYQDNSNFFWDDVNNRLGIGTAMPNNTIQVQDLIKFDNTDLNTSLGYTAGGNIVAGAIRNTFVGYRAGLSSLAGSTNAADDNTAIGYDALFSNTSGKENVAIGSYAFRLNTTGYQNMAIGYAALSSNTTGINNMAIGYAALLYSGKAYYNTAIGAFSLGYLSGDYSHYNVGIGFKAGYFQADGSTPLTTPLQSIYIGSLARGFNNSDVNSIVIGYQAIGIGANTVVLGNDSIVTTALKGNVGIGTTSPYAKLSIEGTTGSSDNLFTADYSSDGTATSTAFVINSSGNLGIGTTTPGAMLSLAGISTDTTPLFMMSTSTASATTTSLVIDSNGLLGIGSSTPFAELSVLGKFAIDGLESIGVTSNPLCLVGKDVMVGTGADCTASSERYKYDIEDQSDALATIMSLRPTSFKLKATDEPRLGLIAEEVYSVEPRLADLDKDGLPASVRYAELTSVLTKAIQELNLKIENISSQYSVDSSQTGQILSFDGILSWLEDKIVRAKEFIADKISAKELCLEDVCINKTQLKELLDKNQPKK